MSIELCVWKIVANNDIEKIGKNEGAVTFSNEKTCYVCDGKVKSCVSYKPVDKEQYNKDKPYFLKSWKDRK